LLQYQFDNFRVEVPSKAPDRFVHYRSILHSHLIDIYIVKHRVLHTLVRLFSNEQAAENGATKSAGTVEKNWYHPYQKLPTPASVSRPSTGFVPHKDSNNSGPYVHRQIEVRCLKETVRLN